jgi:hypothetical protein
MSVVAVRDVALALLDQAPELHGGTVTTPVPHRPDVHLQCIRITQAGEICRSDRPTILAR